MLNENQEYEHQYIRQQSQSIIIIGYYKQKNTMIMLLQCLGDDVITECLTCSMIKMGSSVSYGDDRCPQCGASTTKTFLN